MNATTKNIAYYCRLVLFLILAINQRPFFTNRKLQQFADEGVIKKSQQGSFFCYSSIQGLVQCCDLAIHT